MLTRRHLLKQSGLTLGAGLLFSGGFSMQASATSRSGFWLPEESEPHLRTFMQWPVSRAAYDDSWFLADLQRSIADIANTIVEFEPVVMLMDQRYEKKARRLLSDGIEIWTIPTDDLWCRDSGPVFVRNSSGDLAVSHLNFNGWGNKQPHPNDGRIARTIADRLGLPFLDNGLVGEAGGVESDGAGTLIAHESSWINPNRNKGSKAEVTRLLLDALGADKVIWAPGRSGADITDYHIDALARFVEPGHIVIQMPEKPDPQDPWSVAAFETYDILQQAIDAAGRKLRLTVLPEPYDIRVTAPDFVASYVNYYVCNGAVIAAEFGDRDTDSEARKTLQALYPGREIVMLNVDPVGEVGGGIHCATQQQPAT
ncbi:agmatine deiminase family protein [Coralliovum pocilloporae]|uniref:agmatine deiminase family protein n=1 Tax=Coralliovum pocilloporae TaxID=3066369 RepID=UPI0033076DD1